MKNRTPKSSPSSRLKGRVKDKLGSLGGVRDIRVYFQLKDEANPNVTHTDQMNPLIGDTRLARDGVTRGTEIGGGNDSTS